MPATERVGMQCLLCRPEAADAEIVYVNVFGERHSHLHFNIAPHRVGDALTGGTGMLRDDARSPSREQLTSGAARLRNAMSAET